MGSKYVWLFILFFILQIFILDVYLYSDDISGNSITQVIVSLADRSPLFSGFIGFILGGLFFHFLDIRKQD